VLDKHPEELHDGDDVQKHLTDAEGNSEQEHKEAAPPDGPRLDELDLACVFHGTLQSYLISHSFSASVHDLCQKGLGGASSSVLSEVNVPSARMMTSFLAKMDR
jgi:hypothetical protein